MNCTISTNYRANTTFAFISISLIIEKPFFRKINIMPYVSVSIFVINFKLVLFHKFICLEFAYGVYYYRFI